MGDVLLLAGIDGANPLGFFAALGLLRVLSDRDVSKPTARLSWRNEGRWRAVVSGVESMDEIVSSVLADRETWRDDPVLGLSYSKSEVAGEDGGTDTVAKSPARTAGRGKREGGLVRDLKPSPALCRQFLSSLAMHVSEGKRRPADYGAALVTDVVTDLSGKTKPTALHFTAGQQQFLYMVRELVEGLTEEHVRESLVGPWGGTSKLPSLSWDATVSRAYALRATDPSGETRGSNPGAEWLAFRGLVFFPVAANEELALLTTCCSGGWKTGRFRWPLWTSPASAMAVRSLLGTPDLETLKSSERRARGIGAVLESGITRSEQGGYGAFQPSRVL